MYIYLQKILLDKHLTRICSNVAFIHTLHSQHPLISVDATFQLVFVRRSKNLKNMSLLVMQRSMDADCFVVRNDTRWNVGFDESDLNIKTMIKLFYRLHFTIY